MPETWYFIGPDKTGFDCKVCCAGFSSGGGSCAPYPCSTEEGGYRQYICPNYYNRPTPHHVYSWNGNPSSNVTIRVNDKVCSSSSTQCYSYTPSGGLNAAGRIGSGCSQQYVTSNYNCAPSVVTCPSCAGTECCAQIGVIVINKFCVNTPSGCICSSGSEVNNCNCVCTYQQTDPEAPCYSSDDGGGDDCYITCPDGEVYEYVCGREFNCPCEGDPADISCSGGCDVVSCVYGGYACVSPTYSESCPDGFVRCTDPSSSSIPCTCGQCLCTTASTCCSGAAAGWVYIDSTRSCIPCYSGYEGIPPIDCCDDTWKRKRCAPGEVCCNDGLCYSTNTVLCEYDPP